jgi:predicted DNA binding CopG/RHH family protein
MNKTEKIQMVLTKEDLENIKKAAKLEGLNFSSYARRVIVIYSNKLLKENKVVEENNS